MKANLDKNLAPAWVSGKSYSTGEFCLYNKRLYICTTDNSDAEFDNSKWERRNLVDLVSGINCNLVSEPYVNLNPTRDGTWITVNLGYKPRFVYIGQLTGSMSYKYIEEQSSTNYYAYSASDGGAKNLGVTSTYGGIDVLENGFKYMMKTVGANFIPCVVAF